MTNTEIGHSTAPNTKSGSVERLLILGFHAKTNGTMPINTQPVVESNCSIMKIWSTFASGLKKKKSGKVNITNQKTIVERVTANAATLSETTLDKKRFSFIWL